MHGVQDGRLLRTVRLYAELTVPKIVLDQFAVQRVVQVQFEHLQFAALLDVPDERFAIVRTADQPVAGHVDRQAGHFAFVCGQRADQSQIRIAEQSNATVGAAGDQ